MHASMEELAMAARIVAMALTVWCSRAQYTAVPYSVIMREAAELQVFKSRVKDPKQVTANWALTSYPCRWNGVACRDDNKIISVKLPNSNLEGPLSEGLSRLRYLEVFDLSGNRLTGNIPPAFGNLVKIRDLNLSNNRLRGPIPATLGGMPSLNGRLDFSRNLLEGPIPDELGNLRGLRYLVLSRNRLTGSVPSSLGNFEALTNLDLSRNRLNGSIPDSLGNLWNAVYVDLSWNRLEGGIPDEMAEIESLRHFDVSFNRLSGLIPDSPGFRVFPSSWFANNSGLCFGNSDTTCSPSEPHPDSVVAQFSFLAGSVPTSYVVISAVAIGVLLAFGLGLWTYVAKRHPHILGHVDADADGGAVAKAPLRSFTFEELLLATSNFDGSNFLGEGTHCSTFLGFIQPEKEQEAENNQAGSESQNQQVVAVKCLHPHLINASEEEGGAENFVSEWKARGCLRHPNLVSVLGWCQQAELVAVMVEYAANGTLHAQLHDPNYPTTLVWDQRLNIALGIATGLDFLHNSKKGGPRMSCNLTSTKVLLDEYYNPRLADYRTKLKSSDNVSGTAYAAPELTQDTVTLATKESEVYSFGILALELITGMNPDTNFANLGYGIAEWVQEQFLANALDAVDPLVLRTCATSEHVLTFMQLALMCTNSVAKERPQMPQVLSSLQSIPSSSIGNSNVASQVDEYGQTNNVQYEDYRSANETYQNQDGSYWGA